MNTFVQMGKNFVNNPKEFVTYGFSTTTDTLSRIKKNVEARLDKSNYNYDANRLPEDTYEKNPYGHGMQDILQMQRYARSRR